MILYVEAHGVEVEGIVITDEQLQKLEHTQEEVLETVKYVKDILETYMTVNDKNFMELTTDDIVDEIHRAEENKSEDLSMIVDQQEFLNKVGHLQSLLKTSVSINSKFTVIDNVPSLVKAWGITTQEWEDGAPKNVVLTDDIHNFSTDSKRTAIELVMERIKDWDEYFDFSKIQSYLDSEEYNPETPYTIEYDNTEFIVQKCIFVKVDGNTYKLQHFEKLIEMFA